MTPIHLNKVANLMGFSTQNAEGGNPVRVVVRDLMTSDDANFKIYTEKISNIFLNAAGIPTDNVARFLVLLHQDLSADLYVNDFQTALEIRPKRYIKQGEAVTLSDVADIRKMEFPQIAIVETDKVIFCFKVGWRFGLFFDLGRSEKLDIEKMKISLGDLHRYLSFYHVYKVLESDPHFGKLMRDGWFPFIEIVAVEYKALCEAYRNGFDLENRVQELVDSFGEGRIKKITERWLGNRTFNDKKSLIEAGINAYLQNTQAGFINCIKNLGTEIEGILRIQYLSETGKGDGVKTPDLINHIVAKAENKSGSGYSLLLPRPFLKYLQEVVFANFNLETGDVDLSRHSISHGVASANQYTKTRALQFILTLDQIFFYS